MSPFARGILWRRHLLRVRLAHALQQLHWLSLHHGQCLPHLLHGRLVPVSLWQHELDLAQPRCKEDLALSIVPCAWEGNGRGDHTRVNGIVTYQRVDLHGPTPPAHVRGELDDASIGEYES